VSQKNIPNIVDCNLKKDYEILIIFGKSIPERICCYSTDVQLSSSSKICFCTTKTKPTKYCFFYPMQYYCLI